MSRPSLVVSVVTQKMFPFLLMFGFYIILHGSSSPGGGFQGGVIVGAAYILLAIGIEAGHGRRLAPESRVRWARSLGILIYVTMGLAGVVLGYSFLTNKAAGVPPQGRLGAMLSGGSLVWINIGIATTVAGVVITLFYAFLECGDSRPRHDEEQERP